MNYFTCFALAFVAAGVVMFIYCLVGLFSVGTRWNMTPPSPGKFGLLWLSLTLGLFFPLLAVVV